MKTLELYHSPAYGLDPDMDTYGIYKSYQQEEQHHACMPRLCISFCRHPESSPRIFFIVGPKVITSRSLRVPQAALRFPVGVKLYVHLQMCVLIKYRLSVAYTSNRIARLVGPCAGSRGSSQQSRCK